MPQYKPLGLLRTRTYPGYQFYATLRYKEQPPEACMRFAILTVMEWLREKIGWEDLPEELRTPPAGAFGRAEAEELRSYHFSGGFSLDITSLPEQGIWAARIREPDMEREGRKAVLGRAFETHIGFRRGQEDVECGVRIDVLDPLEAPEVPFAYRPAFLRRLFASPRLHIAQVEPLKYEEPTLVTNPMMLRRLTDLLRDERNQLPVIALTYGTQRRSVQEIVEKLDRSLGLTGSADSFSRQLSQLSLVPETLEFGEAQLPCDAEYMAAHSFGYARVYVIAERFFPALRRETGMDSLRPGDVLVAEPARYGGEMRRVPFEPSDSADTREARRNRLLEDMRCYSKRRQADFGGVIFEPAARRMEAEARFRARLQELRSGEESRAEEKIGEIYQEAQEMIALYEQETKEVRETCESLQAELQGLRGKNASLQERLERQAKREEGIVIRTPEVEEFYQDEQRDLIVSVLRDARRTYCAEGSRAEELLEGILAMNSPTGEGSRLMDQLKAILFRSKNLSDSDVSELRALGFEVTRRSNNHFRLVFRGNPRYVFTLASTGSDVRGMKNAYSEIAARLSVYK